VKQVIYIVLFWVSVIPGNTFGAEPMETLKAPIEQVISVLNDPQYKTFPQKKIQREKLRDIISQIFNYSFIAKSVLGRYHWQNSFTLKEKEEFSDVFARFLGNTYLDQIQEGYEDEKVVFLDQEIINPSKAIVRTAIIRKKTEIPVNYLMRAYNGVWKIYDVNIEGVSLVQNYRSQFRSILLNETAAELIEKLKSKVNQ